MSLHWWPVPEAGEIVWCHFPYDRGIHPGPKPRPALITRVFDDSEPRWIVAVAYGTSQKTDQLRSGEFLIARQDVAAWQLAGLSYPTKFSFHQVLELPFNSDWFGVPPGAPHGQIPRLGTLHPALMTRVRAAWEAAQ